MKAVRTVAATRCYTLPGGTEKNDLWVEEIRDDLERPVIRSTFAPTQQERAAILDGANIELLVWGEAQPPVAIGLSTERVVR